MADKKEPKHLVLFGVVINNIEGVDLISKSPLATPFSDQTLKVDMMKVDINDARLGYTLDAINHLIKDQFETSINRAYQYYRKQGSGIRVIFGGLGIQIEEIPNQQGTIEYAFNNFSLGGYFADFENSAEGDVKDETKG